MGFFSDFTGASAQKDLASANKKANAALTTGYNAQQQDFTTAADSFDPYVKSGQQGQQFYTDLLGLNGDEARATAQGTITSDPLWTGKLSADTNAVLKNLNARGMGASGAAALAGERVLAQNYGDVMDRYGRLGDQGLGATGQQAGVIQNRGNNSWNFGATKAGNDINYGNAMAQSRNTGINNVISLIGAGTNAYKAFSGAPK